MSTPTSQSLPTTADQLKSASLSQLQHWAQLINQQSTASGGTKALLSMSLNKEDLCQGLADYLKIDLTAPAERQPDDVKSAPGPADQARLEKQNDFMLDLYNDRGHREDYKFSSSGPDTVDPETADAQALAKQRFQRP